MGAVAYSIVRFSKRDRSFLILAPAVAAAAIVAVLIAPPSLIAGMLRFSGGFHHTILFPRPDIILAVASIVWFAPMAVAQHLRSESSSSGLLAAFYATALAMIPADFGGAGSLHVVSCSLGFIFLAAVFLSSSSPRPPLQRLWLSAATFVYLFYLAQLVYSVKYQYAESLRCADPAHTLPTTASKISGRLAKALTTFEAHPCPVPIDVEQLAQLTGNQPFIIPFNYDTRLFESAVRSPLYRPSYFYSFFDVSDAAAQQTVVDELHQVDWAFAPTQLVPDPVSPDFEEDLMPVLHFRELHHVLHDDIAVSEIQQNWSPVAQLSPKISLYRRTR